MRSFPPGQSNFLAHPRKSVCLDSCLTRASTHQNNLLIRGNCPLEKVCVAGPRDWDNFPHPLPSGAVCSIRFVHPRIHLSIEYFLDRKFLYQKSLEQSLTRKLLLRNGSGICTQAGLIRKQFTIYRYRQKISLLRGKKDKSRNNRMIALKDRLMTSKMMIHFDGRDEARDESCDETIFPCFPFFDEICKLHSAKEAKN